MAFVNIQITTHPAKYVPKSDVPITFVTNPSEDRSIVARLIHFLLVFKVSGVDSLTFPMSPSLFNIFNIVIQITGAFWVIRRVHQ